jgi:hypothetical protein
VPTGIQAIIEAIFLSGDLKKRYQKLIAARVEQLA